jgi:hypothetical protein
MSGLPLQNDPKLHHEQRVSFEHARRTVQKYWPQYWPLTEAVLSAAATLHFKDIPAAIALFAMGDSGVGKNTVFKMFGWENERLILWRDKFSLAALQSSHGQTSHKALQNRAMFRSTRQKLFLTPELALLFRGKLYVLEERFADLAQWLDGEGRLVDSGTHETLGEKGDFTFVWCGGTTPFYLDTWSTMASLGTRLLFFEVVKGPYLKDDLYPTAIRECHDAVNTFLDLLLPQGGIRTGNWPTTTPEIDQTLQHYAALIALGYGIRKNLRDDGEMRFPTPNHFRSRLGHMIRGRAYAHGRVVVTDDDMQMARWITRSSMPGRRGPVLLALLENRSGTVDTIATKTGLSKDVVRSNLAELLKTGVVEEGDGTAKTRGRPPNTYALSEELFQSVL